MDYCIYHNADFDGVISAVIARRKYPNIKLIGWTYGWRLPTLLANKEILIVDLSFSSEELNAIAASAKSVTVIDHHKSSLAVVAPTTKMIIDTKRSGCEITYAELIGNELAPDYVKLISDWDRKGMRASDDAQVLQFGLETIVSKDPEDPFWSILGLQNRVAEASKAGIYVREYLLKEGERCSDWYGFRTEILGLKAIAACSTLAPYLHFLNDKYNEYDVKCVFRLGRSGKWSFSISSNKYDCAFIAEKFGGGGHANVAGFSCNEIPFTIMP